MDRVSLASLGKEFQREVAEGKKEVWVQMFSPITQVLGSHSYVLNLNNVGILSLLLLSF